MGPKKQKTPKNTEFEDASSGAAQAIFVVGMHRSATSAFAGSLEVLGARLPVRLNPANQFNPKGYFESISVIESNDRVLASGLRNWCDFRPINLPDGEQRNWTVSHFARVLRTEFDQGAFVALKDPRVSLLAPIWVDAAIRTGYQPSFVIMLRDPVASASSIMRRDGFSDEASIALWLRYMFDAERHSRGYSRVLVRSEALMRDPVATLDYVGLELGVSWPIAPADVSEELAGFIDKRLFTESKDMQIALADFASEVYAAFARGLDDEQNLLAIDQLSAEFDAMCPALHERMTFDQVSKSAQLKWKTDALSEELKKVPELEAANAELESKICSLEGEASSSVALIGELKSVIDEREKEIERALQAEVSSEALVGELKSVIDEREKEIERALQAEASSEALFGELNSVIDELKNEIDRFREKALTERKLVEEERLTLLQKLFDREERITEKEKQVHAYLDGVMQHDSEGKYRGKSSQQLAIELIERSAFFDQSFYRDQNPDVVSAGMEPSVHYHLFGWKELRDPSPYFSVRSYLESNPDIAAGEMDPLLHYIQNGRAEGREIVSVAEALVSTGARTDNTQACDSSDEARLIEDVKTISKDMNGEGFSKLTDLKHQELIDELAYYKSRDLVSVRELQQSQTKISSLESDISLVSSQLTSARKRPLLVLRELATYRMLLLLSRLPKPFSQRMTQRFVKSAAKRDPERLANNAPIQVSTPIPSLEVETPRGKAGSNIGLNLGLTARKPNRETVLVVSHEATRTGAPVLSLGIIHELSKRYDVISVTLLGGALEREFKKAAFENIELDRASMSHAEITDAIFNIAQTFKPSFAMVNSVANYQVHVGLEKAGIPSISLIHEFASNMLVHPLFAETINKSDKVIFSTELTLSNFLELDHASRPLKVDVIPQGRTLLPSAAVDKVVLKTEEAMIERICGSDPDEVVIVAMGTIDYRKGPDIFIEIARLMREQAPAKTYRFVWVGEGLDLSRSVFPRFLVDQVKRSQLQGHFHFMPAIASLDKLYAAADALVITSRLDPLPNVGIDALYAGLPLFCFDKTSGFAELLKSHELENCVANYFDANDMARKLISGLPDKEKASQLGEAQKDALTPLFDMEEYVAKLEKIGKKLDGARVQFNGDLDVIESSGVFRRDFYNVQGSKASNRDLVAEYMRSSKSGRDVMKAIPGFHPFIYAKENSLESIEDPLAHYVKNGEPDGCWKYELINEKSDIDIVSAKALTSALHIHAFYPELVVPIVDRLNMNEMRPDLFISTRSGFEVAAEEAAEKYAGRIVDVRSFPNLGRDIGPMLTGFGSELSQYDVIGHVHTKKSFHVQSRDQVNKWNEFLLSNTIGSPKAGAMLDRIMTRLSQDKDVVIVYPDDPGVNSWTENLEVAAPIAKRLGIAELPIYFNFPVGSMFWMRSSLFQRFVDLGYDWKDYSREPLPIDGTELHTLERLFGVVPQVEGLKTAVTNVFGITR